MKKKEYIALAVIIVLLGSYLLLRSSDRTQYELPTIEDITPEDITRIDITASGEGVELSRSDDEWRIGENEYPADESKVKEILSVLKNLKLTALVSETGVYSPYDLTEDKKIEVRAWTGDRLVRNLAIGKTADTYQHTFVQLGDDPNVYHASGNFRQTFDKSVEDLRDKTALSFSTDDITGIDIVSAGKRLSLSLEDLPAETPAGETPEEPEAEVPEPVWIQDDGMPADSDAVERLLSQLAYLNCSGYIEGGQKNDFTKPISTLTIKGKETYTLSLYDAGEGGTSCPAVSSQNDYPFTLNETACSRLTETLKTLLGTETDG